MFQAGTGLISTGRCEGVAEDIWALVREPHLKARSDYQHQLVQTLLESDKHAFDALAHSLIMPLEEPELALRDIDLDCALRPESGFRMKAKERLKLARLIVESEPLFSTAENQERITGLARSWLSRGAAG
jgi:hypothetical protein